MFQKIDFPVYGIKLFFLRYFLFNESDSYTFKVTFVSHVLIKTVLTNFRNYLDIRHNEVRLWHLNNMKDILINITMLLYNATVLYNDM